jgi:hypothetical protein
VTTAADSPDGDLAEWQRLMLAAFDRREGGAEDQLGAFLRDRALTERPSRENEIHAVGVVHGDEDRVRMPESRANRRAAAGLHRVDTVTRSDVRPDGSIEWPDDKPGGLPGIWDR